MKCLAALVALCLAVCSSVAASTPRFQPRACLSPPLKGVARCGTVTVPENWNNGRGRLALNVAILPALDGSPIAPPLFDLAGGPGIAAVDGAGFYLSDGLEYRRGREIVLVDQRGTGGSGPLNCPQLQSQAASRLPLYPPGAVRACRRALSKHADLRRYTTDDAARDVAAVRIALGYRKIDIIALSYGTTLALRYLVREPLRAHAVVLLGPVPPAAMPPRDHAVVASDALKAILADCRAEPPCAAAFPDLDGDLDRIPRASASAGRPPPELVMEAIRTRLYAPASARTAPLLIHRTAQGDMGWIGEQQPAAQGSAFADGLYLSVTCSESMALMPYAIAAKRARRTPFGDYRLRRQRQACRHWPSVKVARDRLALPASPAPVLILSGRLDPAAAPAWAEGLARALPNARNLVMPSGGHILDGLQGLDTCFDPLVRQFLANAKLDEVDGACLATMRAPPFQLPAAPQAY